MKEAGREERLGQRTLGLLARVLGHRLSPPWMIVVSALILCLSLDTGLSADDYVHSLMLDGAEEVPGFSGRASWDLFRFTTPQTTPVLQNDGVLSWWDDPRGRLAFFRPISALTHALDHAWFPGSGPLQHLHSVLWALLVFTGVWALYAQLLPPGMLLGLSLFLYVLDDARAWFSSWVAGRNTVVATAFSVWALALHVAYRRTADRRAYAAALLLFPLALLSGEGSLAIGAYLLGYALFLDRAAWPKALLPLLPYGAIVVLWRIIYKRLGYGAAHSYLYTDPGSEPLTYLSRLLERGPVLWLSQLGGPWSDNWSSFFVFPTFKQGLYVVAVIGLCSAVLLCWPLIRREPLLRFFGLGAALSTLPASAAFPADRLLNWMSIGAAPLLAYLMVDCLQTESRGTLLRRFKGVAAGYLIAVHMIVGPLVMTSRARGNVALRDVLLRCDAALPKDESIRDKEVFYLNPPAVPLAAYSPIMRAATGVPIAKRQLVMGVSTVPLTVKRTGERTLELSSQLSLFWNPGSQLLIGPDSRFSPGDQRQVGDVRITVLEVDGLGGPLRTRFEWPRPLSDEHYVFLQWVGSTYGSFTPPAVGSQTVLPAADYLQALLGEKTFIEAKYPLDANDPS